MQSPRGLPPRLEMCPKLKAIKLTWNKCTVQATLSTSLTWTWRVGAPEGGELIGTVTDPGPARRKELVRTEQCIRHLASYYLTPLTDCDISLLECYISFNFFFVIETLTTMIIELSLLITFNK